MINSNININSSSTSRINALVELYEGSTLVTTCTCADVLQSFKVERLGEDGKFFGTCISQTLKLELIDKDKVLNITKDYSIKVAYLVGGETVYPYPVFYVQDVVRDEETNDLSITAVDRILQAENITVADLNLPVDAYTIGTVFVACANALDCNRSTKYLSMTEPIFSLTLPVGANFSGDENIREVLKRLAEVLGAVCYVAAGTAKDKLVFHRLAKDAAPDFTIQKKDYFELKTEAARTLGQLCHVTELGDNIETTAAAEGGEVQYLRNNPFFEAIQQKEDEAGTVVGQTELADYLEETLAPAVYGTTITPFNCDWRGNFLLEPGDKIAVTTKDGGTITTYVLNQAAAFDGTYGEIIQWSYEATEDETPAAPATLGEVLNQTFARVNKAEKEITLHTSELNEQGNRMTALEINTEGLTATVSTVSTKVDESVENLNQELGTLINTVETKITSTEAQITVINEKIAEGVEKVTTSTGFTFDETGLTVSNSESEMTTTITEDGMKVYKNSEEMLVADHTGVKATNLHATTYLMVGGRSRFENYESNRTGCFWIGGND